MGEGIGQKGGRRDEREKMEKDVTLSAWLPQRAEGLGDHGGYSSLFVWKKERRGTSSKKE